jgi:hypothetical protein
MRNLKELEMRLETLEERKEEFELVVCEAQAWDFPMSNDSVLTTRGSTVRRS